MNAAPPPGTPRRVGFFDHPLLTAHAPGAEHPERPARVRAVREALTLSGQRAALRDIESVAIDLDDVARVHTPALIEQVRETSRRAFTQIDPDTAASRDSYAAALFSAGGAAQAALATARGELDAALVLARPPGHHAETGRAMGFCLFNNVAIAARHVMHAGAAKRVAIVDWDVHHGNGTQEIFYHDAEVLYVSVHQFPFYPGTGAEDEVGAGAGRGATLNVPLAEGCGDAIYDAVFETLTVPKLTAFRPDLVLVSAGFDAHAKDPIGGMTLSGAGYGGLCWRLIEACGRLGAAGPVLVLEGGYALEGLAESAVACASQLLAPRAFTAAGAVDADNQRLLNRIRQQHQLGGL